MSLLSTVPVEDRESAGRPDRVELPTIRIGGGRSIHAELQARKMERAPGVEPGYAAWKVAAQPIDQARKNTVLQAFFR
jgi:hypothetical protein